MAEPPVEPAGPPAPGRRLCPWCGGDVPAQSGPGRRRWWCSQRCKREANHQLRQWRVYREAVLAELDEYRGWVSGTGGPYGRDRAAAFARSAIEKLDGIDAEVARLEAMTDPRQGTRAAL